MTTTVEITVKFPKGYIADPYWPALNKLIDIQKKSGMNRAKSDANRRKALEEYLKREEMTLADYEKLEAESEQPFYFDKYGNIIIPELHVFGFLVNTCHVARAATRPCEPEQVRSRFVCSPWLTDKRKADDVWERFVTVSAGTGAKLSNQRGFRRSAYIADFTAVGAIKFDSQYVEPKTLRNALEYGGSDVGIGASRKMGWGRFDLVSFEEQ